MFGKYYFSTSGTKHAAALNSWTLLYTDFQKICLYKFLSQDFYKTIHIELIGTIESIYYFN